MSLRRFTQFLTCLIVPLVAGVPLVAQPVPLFDDIGPNAVVHYPPRHSLSAYPVDVNVVALSTPTPELAIELPPYGTFVADLSQFSPYGSTFFWNGFFRDVPGWASPSVTNGFFFSGWFHADGHSFLLNTTGDEVHLFEHGCMSFPYEPPYDPNDVDLRLELDYAPESVASGSEGTVYFTVTNLGPETAGTLPVDCGRRLLGSSSRLPIPSSDGVPLVDFEMVDGCTLEGYQELGEDEAYFHVWVEEELAPGESRTCEMLYRVHPSASSSDPIVVDWRMLAQQDAESNPVDNDATMVLRLGVTAVPTLSPVGGAVLCVALFAAFLLVSRRSRRPATK